MVISAEMSVPLPTPEGPTITRTQGVVVDPSTAGDDGLEDKHCPIAFSVRAEIRALSFSAYIFRTIHG